MPTIDLIAILERITTATLTTVLYKRGYNNMWIRQSKPLKPSMKRIAGPAFTLRFVPARADLASPASWNSPTSTRAAVEAIPEGAIAVVDAMGSRDAGVFGDILCARMAARGVAGMVTDGAVRDAAGIISGSLPVWCTDLAAPPAVAALSFVGWGDVIGCGGVAVESGDLIVADDDGAVVIPKAIAQEVAEEAAKQEDLEAWILKEVEQGGALPGLYPPDEAALERYKASI